MRSPNKNTAVEKALFIPLKREFFEAFARGKKIAEYREYGPRWNERTCRVGRAVTLSLGYGKARRLHGVVEFFDTCATPQLLPGWSSCYGDTHRTAAVIGINLFLECRHVNILTRAGFCYDEIRCVDCGAWLGEAVS